MRRSGKVVLALVGRLCSGQVINERKASASPFALSLSKGSALTRPRAPDPFDGLRANGLRGFLGDTKLAWWLFVAIASTTASASVDYVPQPIERAIRAAEIVAHVRITTVTVTPCGINYVTEVLQPYQGKSESALTFTARRSPISNRDREVREGDELLVLLAPRSTAQEPYGNCCTAAKSPPPSNAELQCRAQLAPLTPLLDFESAFLLERRAESSAGSPTLWLWYDRLRTEPPADLERRDIRVQTSGRAKCDGPYCRVRWKALERRIPNWVKPRASIGDSRK